MAKQDWNSKDFNFHGGYLTYQGKFVARFKYRRKGYRPSFRKFLVANFTPTEYFERTSGQGPECSPVKVLESKGWIAPHIQKILSDHGYEPTLPGFDKYIQDQIDARSRAS